MACRYDTDGDGDCAGCANMVGCLAPKSEQIAHAVLTELFFRAGFEEFWDEIQADVQEGIRDDLVRVIEDGLIG